jgi:hypothetical protein
MNLNGKTKHVCVLVPCYVINILSFKRESTANIRHKGLNYLGLINIIKVMTAYP